MIIVWYSNSTGAAICHFRVDLGAQMELVKLSESLTLFRQTTRYTSRWCWSFIHLDLNIR
jgi:hypothetical protein